MITTLSAEILGNSGSLDKVYELPSNQSDESLIGGIVNGNEESFNNLISRYRDKMYNIAFRVTDNHSDAEDVVQEACICLYKKAHTFKQSSKFSTWLYRIVTNEAISRLRQNKRSRAESLDNYMPGFDDSGRHIERPVMDWSQDIEKKVAESELHAIIENALSLLSPLDKSIVVLSEV
ncbi:MAG: RNA polymerase sigma factor, partial [Candidatus Dadabacteria bacterium]